MSAVRVEEVGPAIVVTLDRPDTHNAVDRDAGEAIAAAVARAGDDPRVRGVVLTGGGDRTFVSGGDLNMIAGMVGSGVGGQGVLDLGDLLAVCERVPVPVVAAVQGDAFGGGCELLLLCDLVVMESHAGLSFRHVKMGLSPAWGGLTRLVERVGPLEAARLLYTADRVDAAEARGLGLVNEVVPKGQARARALSLIGRIAESPRATVAGLKRALHEVRDAHRGDAGARERAIFLERWAGAEVREAMAAFSTRRRRAEG